MQRHSSKRVTDKKKGLDKERNNEVEDWKMFHADGTRHEGEVFERMVLQSVMAYSCSGWCGFH